MTIQIETPKDSIIIDNVEYLLTPKSKVIELLNEREAVKKERLIIKNTVIKFLLLLGIIDEKTGKIKEDLGKSKFGFIASLTGKIPKLFDMFSKENGEGSKMIEDLKPLLNKYAND